MLWINTGCVINPITNPDLINQYVTVYEGQIKKHIEVELIFNDTEEATKFGIN